MELHSILKDIVLAICHMHNENLAHLDIKPENFLMVGSKYCLSDFGTGIDMHYEAKKEEKIFF